MGSVRVAVADDDPAMLDVMRLLFSANSFELAGVATNGENAIELVRTTRPTVLVLDVNMPGIDGCEVARVVCAEHPETRVVLYTASPEHVPPDVSSFVDAVVPKVDPLPVLVGAVITAAARQRGS